MSCLVCKYADDLVRRLGFDQCAGIDEDAASIHHEGVERAVVENDDADVLLRQAGGAQDRRGIFLEQLFGLGIANNREAA